MFRDSPVQFANYRVLDEHGREMPRKDWLVNRIYDGNPVGYGVGVQPPPVLEQEFGVVHSQEEVERHFAAQLRRPQHRHVSVVEVVQEVVGPMSRQRVGVVQRNRWKIVRDDR
jgi:hypothetical protein